MPKSSRRSRRNCRQVAAADAGRRPEPLQTRRIARNRRMMAGVEDYSALRASPSGPPLRALSFPSGLAPSHCWPSNGSDRNNSGWGGRIIRRYAPHPSGAAPKAGRYPSRRDSTREPLQRDEWLAPTNDGWGGRIRTSVWRDQNPLPYRLATPQLGNQQSARRLRLEQSPVLQATASHSVRAPKTLRLPAAPRAGSRGRDPRVSTAKKTHAPVPRQSRGTERRQPVEGPRHLRIAVPHDP